MEKELKDYLHLYLGCKVQFEFITNVGKKELRTGTLSGITKDGIVQEALIYCHGYHKNRLDLITPFLHPLNNMTEEDASELWSILDWNDAIPKNMRSQLIIDEFDTIKRNNDITDNAHWGFFIKILPALLSKHFDLFGLIEAGIAIRKPKQQYLP